MSVVVVGGANGIGLGAALAFKKREHQVIIVDIDADNGIRVAKEHDLAFHYCDIANPQWVEDAFGAIAELYPPFDIAINAAGILGAKRTLHEYDATLWHHVIDVNLMGMFFCMQQELKVMPKGSVIINLSSVAGEEVDPALPPVSAYIASKFGVNGLTLAAAQEYKHLCTIAALAPTGIKTNMLRELWDSTTVTEGIEPFVVGEILAWLAIEGRDKIHGRILSANDCRKLEWGT